MQLKNMLHFKMAWARPEGPDHEVVLSSRVRLARNLGGSPFPSRCAPGELEEVRKRAFAAAAGARSLAGAAHIELGTLDAVDRLLLVERRLASNLLAAEPAHRGVVVGEHEALSLMVNEEDHLRLQAIDSGLCLSLLLERTNALDDELSGPLRPAFHKEFGYLTTCPTNAGTGLRASCLVHLPGLTLTGELAGILTELSRKGVVARGLYGEGTKVMGDFYQISNAISLGPGEDSIIAAVTRIVGDLIEKEKGARAELSSGGRRTRLEDLVHRSLGALSGARLMTYEEAMRHLSYARMGLSLGWGSSDLKTVNELIVLCQPAHIQMLADKDLDSPDRDFLRSTLLRRKFDF